MSDKVMIAGELNSSQDGVVVMGGGHFPMPHRCDGYGWRSDTDDSICL